jgi:Flp pilus assembly protein CpaB
MKRLIVALCALAVATAFTVNAAEEAKKEAAPEKAKPTPEQRAFMKEMVAKYDTDGDKKLSKEERAKISAEDKEKMKANHGKAAAPGQNKEKKEKKQK